MPTVLKKPKTVQATYVKCARTLPTMRSALNAQIRFVSMRRRMESKRLPASVNLLTRKYLTEIFFRIKREFSQLFTYIINLSSDQKGIVQRTLNNLRV